MKFTVKHIFMRLLKPEMIRRLALKHNLYKLVAFLSGVMLLLFIINEMGFVGRILVSKIYGTRGGNA